MIGTTRIKPGVSSSLLKTPHCTCIASTASATPIISKKPTGERMPKYRYNVIPDRPDARDCRVALPSRATVDALPCNIDLRGTPYMPEVWDQGSEGSCTAHGNGGVFEIQRRVQGFPPMMPSRKLIYRLERQLEGDLSVDGGAQVRTGIQVMAKFGVCAEELYPYTVDDFTTDASPEAYT